MRCGLRVGVQAECAQVAEWLMAADCKSATLRVTEVRILPCAPLVFVVRVESCGSKPCRQRTNVDCTCRHRGIGSAFLAYDAAGKVSVVDMDFVRLFCLPRRTGTLPFAIRCKEFQQVASSFLCWRSSVVEHSLGKGEVESSSLSVSSRLLFQSRKWTNRAGVTQW